MASSWTPLGSGPDDVDAALGGLVPPKRHVAELAADALHGALGAVAKAGTPEPSASPRRTLVAMSGGVDSAAAAQLALDAGDEVVAVTLELRADPATDGDKSCCSPQAVLGARRLAHGMGLPHLTLDLRERFRASVVDEFLDGYAAGRTPNPCVRCNGEVRFDAMLELADAGGRAASRPVTTPASRATPRPAGARRRRRARTRATCSRASTRRISTGLVPARRPHEGRVRALAREAGLPVADKRESQDLCFVAGLGGRAFLQRHGGPRLRRPGEIVDRRGEVLGHHDGQHNSRSASDAGWAWRGPEPLYVLERDARTGRVVVGPRSEAATTRIALEDTPPPSRPSEVETVRMRYHSKQLHCAVREAPGGRLELELDEPATRSRAGAARLPHA